MLVWFDYVLIILIYHRHKILNLWHGSSRRPSLCWRLPPLAFFDHRPLYIECAMGPLNGDTPSQFLGPINITKPETTPITQEDDDLVSNIAG